MKFIKPLIFFIIGMIIILCMLSSCAPHRTIITTQGQIIDRDGDSYLILWKDLADKPFSYAYNWVYHPGLSDTPLDQIKVTISIDRKEEVQKLQKGKPNT